MLSRIITKIENNSVEIDCGEFHVSLRDNGSPVLLRNDCLNKDQPDLSIEVLLTNVATPSRFSKKI